MDLLENRGAKKAQDADTDGMKNVDSNISIQCIINVHVVRRGLPGPISLQDPKVSGVGVGRSELSYVSSRGGRGQVERR